LEKIEGMPLAKNGKKGGEKVDQKKKKEMVY